MMAAEIIYSNVECVAVYVETNERFSIELYFDKDSRNIVVNAKSYMVEHNVTRTIENRYNSIKSLTREWLFCKYDLMKVIRYFHEIYYPFFAEFIGGDFPSSPDVIYIFDGIKYKLNLWCMEDGITISMVDKNDNTNHFNIETINDLNKQSLRIKNMFYREQFKNVIMSVIQASKYIDFLANEFATIMNIIPNKITNKKFPIVCICGSTKFKDEFIRSARFYEAIGYVVLTTHIFSHSDNIKLSDSSVNQLKQLYAQMIEMCDELHVVNVNDYIGENTANEIEYAKSLGKTITYSYTHNDK